MSDDQYLDEKAIVIITHRPSLYREGAGYFLPVDWLDDASTGVTSILNTVTAANSGFFAYDHLYGSGYNGTLIGGVRDKARMGVIAGTVLDIQAQPVSRRVRVHERATGRIVRETWSDADGKYRFTDLDPRRAFYVMAFDHTLQQNAVVSDNVHPELEDSP